MKQFNSRNHKPNTRMALAALGAFVLLLLAPPPATAKNVHNEKAATTTKKKSVNKITYQRSSSEESPAERDRRLYRECRGLPNAGACLGYARGK